MGFFDFLWGEDKANQAAQANAQAAAAYQAQLDNVYGGYEKNALGTLGEARTSALGALGTGFEGTLGSLQSGLGQLQGVSTAPLQTAVGTLQGGAGNLQSALQAQQGGLSALQGAAAGAEAAGRAGVSAYDPLTAQVRGYDPAIQAYRNSLGLGGAEGTAAAQNMFTTSPGYQFQVDEATRNAQANASRLGIAGSGNTLGALGERLGNIALQEYGGWQNRLGAYEPLQLQAQTAASSGIAGANRSLADILAGGGRDVATGYGNVAGAYGNLYGGARDVAGAYGNLFAGEQSRARDIAGAYGGIGGAYGQNAAQQAGLYTGYGQDVSNVYGNIAAGRGQGARDAAQIQIAGNNARAQAAAQDAANVWGLLGAGVKGAGAAFGAFA